MKINFIIPFKRISGGIRVVYIYAQYLVNQGHDVCCFLPAISYPGLGQNIPFRIKASISNIIKPEHWFQCNFPIKVVPKISDLFVRDADVVVASSWQTAYDVVKLDDKKGKKYYFVQGYEIFNGTKDDVEGTYKLGIPIITISSYLANIIAPFSPDVEIIHNGLFPEEYISKEKKTNNVLTILVFYHESPDKGTMDALEIVYEVKKKIPIRVLMFGRKIFSKFSEDIEVYESPNREKIIQLYQKSDIYLFTSKVDAWGLTAVEAMANKCAVIGNDVGAIHELNNGKNCKVATQKEEYVNYIEYFQNHRLELARLQNEGFITASTLSWKNSCEMFEKCISK